MDKLYFVLNLIGLSLRTILSKTIRTKSSLMHATS